MKITKEHLRQVIKEELALVLNESAAGEPSWKGYLGWHVPNESVDTSGVDAQLINNRIQRDGKDVYHITIISPPETRDIVQNIKKEQELSGGKAKKAAKEALLKRADALADYDFNIGETKSIEGPGDGSVGAKGEDSVAVFKTVEWPEAQALRAEFGLGPKDLHITLGIGVNGDVHGSKN